jgi:hypothetical protein
VDVVADLYVRKCNLGILNVLAYVYANLSNSSANVMTGQVCTPATSGAYYVTILLVITASV